MITKYDSEIAVAITKRIKYVSSHAFIKKENVFSE